MKNTDKSAYIIVPPFSFGYNPARINVGSIGYYNGKKNVIVSSLYEVFQTNNALNDQFLWYWLKSDELPKWIEKLQEGSVRLYFYYDKLEQCLISISSIEEQTKIGQYFSQLDNLITLHQRIIVLKDGDLGKLHKQSFKNKKSIIYVIFRCIFTVLKLFNYKMKLHIELFIYYGNILIVGGFPPKKAVYPTITKWELKKRCTLPIQILYLKKCELKK